MSILIFAESPGGRCKKTAFEAVTYGAKLAQKLGQSCIALTIGSPENGGDLGKYGASRVVNIPSDYAHLDGKTYTKAIQQVAEQEEASVLILNHSSTGRSLAGRLAVRLDAPLVSGVNGIPDIEDGFKVGKPVFSGKAMATYEVEGDRKILTVMGNSIPPEVTGESVPVNDLSIQMEASTLTLVETKTQSGSVPLPEAELVVSGGRGFKGPENWGILEDLAAALGAATACSRPVADSEWRPHHEHVGQTGVTIRPNLYIAIGISGAIQHLGGVNNSRTIVVINKDPEAPFFKAADYGVVGDLFDVVPRLTDAIKTFKANTN